MKDEELDMLIANVEYEPQQLKDYITNLQEENEELKKNQRLTPEQRQHLHLELDEILEIYKQRIDKAIEYIWSTKYEYGDLEEDNEDFDIDVYELLNILNGGDE